MSVKEEQQLYQEQLIALSRSPFHCYTLTSPTHEWELKNRMCGDLVKVFLRVEDGKVAEASFAGESCAICKASASLMIQKLEGLSLDQLMSFGRGFLEGVKNWDFTFMRVEGLEILSVIEKFPSRSRCLSLPWEALMKSMDHKKTTDDE